MQRRRTALALGAILLAGAVSAEAAAQPPGGVAPPYIVGENHGFEVYSNSQWRLGSGGRAKQFTRHTGMTSGDRSGTVWARRCSARRQVVRFRREVWLPGTPAASDVESEHLHVSFAPYDVEGRDIERYELRLNGSPAARATRRTLFHSRNLDVRKLHQGFNTIEFVVVKKPGRCRSWDQRRLRWVPYRGVWFGLMGGHFATDLEVGQGGPQVAYTRTRNVLLSIGVRNRGPTEVRHARFELAMNPRPMQPTAPGKVWARFSSEGAVTGCGEVAGDSFFVVLRCDWADFGPGDEGRVLAELMFLPEKPEFVRFEQELDWTVSIVEPFAFADVVEESDPRDDGRQDIRHVFCGPWDRSPECVNAP